MKGCRTAFIFSKIDLVQFDLVDALYLATSGAQGALEIRNNLILQPTSPFLSAFFPLFFLVLFPMIKILLLCIIEKFLSLLTSLSE